MFILVVEFLLMLETKLGKIMDLKSYLESNSDISADSIIASAIRTRCQQDTKSQKRSIADIAALVTVSSPHFVSQRQFR